MYCLLSLNLALVYNSRKRKLSLEVGMYIYQPGQEFEIITAQRQRREKNEGLGAVHEVE